MQHVDEWGNKIYLRNFGVNNSREKKILQV